MDGVAGTAAGIVAAEGWTGVAVIGPNMPWSDQSGQSRLIAFGLPKLLAEFPIAWGQARH
jgi:hypothetical protein